MNTKKQAVTAGVLFFISAVLVGAIYNLMAVTVAASVPIDCATEPQLQHELIDHEAEALDALNEIYTSRPGTAHVPLAVIEGNIKAAKSLRKQLDPVQKILSLSICVQQPAEGTRQTDHDADDRLG
jgi:hypothetical protein